MNPRRSPGFVFGYHAEDEFTQFPVHAFSSCTLAPRISPTALRFREFSEPSATEALDPDYFNAPPLKYPADFKADRSFLRATAFIGQTHSL
jgi:hypothetical protein